MFLRCVQLMCRRPMSAPLIYCGHRSWAFRLMVLIVSVATLPSIAHCQNRSSPSDNGGIERYATPESLNQQWVLDVSSGHASSIRQMMGSSWIAERQFVNNGKAAPPYRCASRGCINSTEDGHPISVVMRLCSLEEDGGVSYAFVDVVNPDYHFVLEDDESAGFIEQFRLDDFEQTQGWAIKTISNSFDRTLRDRVSIEVDRPDSRDVLTWLVDKSFACSAYQYFLFPLVDVLRSRPRYTAVSVVDVPDFYLGSEPGVKGLAIDCEFDPPLERGIGRFYSGRFTLVPEAGWVVAESHAIASDGDGPKYAMTIRMQYRHQPGGLPMLATERQDASDESTFPVEASDDHRTMTITPVESEIDCETLPVRLSDYGFSEPDLDDSTRGWLLPTIVALVALVVVAVGLRMMR